MIKNSKGIPSHKYPSLKLPEIEIDDKFRFNLIKKVKIDEICEWKQKDVKGNKKGSYIKTIQEKNR